ncbi:MAG: hypothetical protein ACTJHT_13935 [Sphingobacterium sp.]|uniref:hypothetical protein n=1 Tax=Sphingobacterium sp. JB170 TaxID=1434842 RepID=UPI00097F0C2D|nr:hypothetical protein [Sphingobacterium sp. JB170]SJN45552.1 hypothetical protein FM107_13755 [Sphingobacterium sp. JB170]
MEEQNDKFSEDLNRDSTPRTEVPQTAKDQLNDEPAAKTIPWTMIIAIAVLLLIYFLFIR